MECDNETKQLILNGTKTNPKIAEQTRRFLHFRKKEVVYDSSLVLLRPFFVDGILESTYFQSLRGTKINVLDK